MDRPVIGRALVAGRARGEIVALAEPLSFWGGFDAETGRIIDEHHPQTGVQLTDRIVVMPSGRGSSSAPSVITEAARLGTLPAALVLREADEILATGAIVADELYGTTLPIVVLDESDHHALAAASFASIAADGTITAD